MKYKYLHVGGATIFFKPFIDTLDAEFNKNEHLFILYDSICSEELKNEENVVLFKSKSLKGLFCYGLILWHILYAKKVFFHGFFDPKALLLLYLCPFWENKVYWVAWGADLYDRYYEHKGIKEKISKYLRAAVIKRVRHIVTYLKGDYERAVKWFGCNAEYHECLMYPSNLYKETEVKLRSNDILNIMVGNSADPLNNHIEVFDRLVGNIPDGTKIHSPLSYGDEHYKKVVIKKGKELFGDNFHPILELMTPGDYLNFLNEMDVVIFNHPIQQAMGNTITALGLGKMMFLRNGTSQWTFFNDIKIKVFDLANLEVTLLEQSNQPNMVNKEKIKNYFSKENYLRQLVNIFNN